MIVFPTLKPNRARKGIENEIMEELIRSTTSGVRVDVGMESRRPIWDAIWAARKTEQGERMTMKKMREK